GLDTLTLGAGCLCNLNWFCVLQGCDPFAQTQRSKLQNRRARINQQINKEMRMRAGAENLFRATTNHKVKETVALELSFVNSNLQLLKEELEELNSSVESLLLLSICFRNSVLSKGSDFIREHYHEDGSKYDQEMKELLDLRQAMRTPSRNAAGIELLMEYYNQLYFIDNRFFPPNKHLGIFFHWYDSLTGVPSYQRALAFEKGSVLFNIGALYTQVGARQDRTSLEGIDHAINAFQKAAGALNYLKENFSNAPSLDMSTSSLNMLVRLMIAQVQECVFEKVVLAGISAQFLAQLQSAQEAARVADVYSLVYQTMTQPPVKDYVPFSWTTMVQVKSEYFKALSHYFAAIALCDHISEYSEDDESEHEKGLQQLHVSAPQGPSLLAILRDQEERRKLGKAHLKKAIIKHEEALRMHGLCKILRKMDVLQEVLALAHKRSLNKYSHIDHEEDFFDTIEAPEIHPKTQQKPEIKTPNFCKVKVTDIFHRLGPLAVFSAKNHCSPARTVHLERSEWGFGFTLRGDSPVLIAGVIPEGCADEAGLKEGDYIVTVNGTDCRWAKHAEVVQLLKSLSTEGVSVSQAERKSLLGPTSSAGDKENSRKMTDNSRSSGSLLTWNKRKTTSKGGSTCSLPFIAVRDNGSFY
uniref:Rhophilin Rho GTPase binding protein 1 n=1 Tax=Callorhinchus milii TaxID=7868 RepID=A0A4W3H0R6_CALMI